MIEIALVVTAGLTLLAGAGTGTALRPVLTALATLFAIGAVSHRAGAYDILSSSEGLLQACDEFERTVRRKEGDVLSFAGEGAFACWGFIGAIQEVAFYPDPITKRPLLGVCLPPATTVTQLILVFTNFARPHPEVLPQWPAYAVLQAFRSAFPCPLPDP